MTTASFLSNTTASPRQMVLIGLLGIILIGVIAYEFLPSSAESVALTPRRSAASGTSPVASGTLPATLAPEWPSISVETVVSHNPFRLDARWLAPIIEEVPPEAAGTDPQPSEALAAEPVPSPIVQERVSWVLLQTGNEMAGLGNRTVRVGDIVSGYRISAITADGIVLVPKE